MKKGIISPLPCSSENMRIIVIILLCIAFGTSRASDFKSGSDSTDKPKAQKQESTAKNVAGDEKPKPGDTTGYPNSSLFILDLRTMQIRSEQEFWNLPNKRNVPFDVPFLLKIEGIDTGTVVDTVFLNITRDKKWDVPYQKMTIGKIRKLGNKIRDNDTIFNDDSVLVYSSYFRTDLVKNQDIVLSIPPLRANSAYTFNFYIITKPGKSQVKAFTATALLAIEKSLLSNYINLIQGEINKTAIEKVLKPQWNDILNEPFQSKSIKENGGVKTDKKSINFTKSESNSLERVMGRVIDYCMKIFPLFREIKSTDHELDLTGKILDKVRTQLCKTASQDTVLPEILLGFAGVDTLVDYIQHENLLFDTAYLIRLVSNLNATIVAFDKASRDTNFKTQETNIKSAIQIMGRRVEMINSLKSELDNLNYYLNTSELAVTIGIKALTLLSMNVNTSSTFKVRAKWYFCPDVGIALIMRTGVGVKVVPYYGLNFNFMPINREAHYSLFSIGRTITDDCKGFYRFMQSLSFMAGITMLTTPNYMDDHWQGVIGSYGLLTGLGLRINDFLRVCGGAMWMNLKNNNPTISTYKLTATPFVSLALDLDMVGYIQKISENVQLNKFSIKH